MGFNANKQTGNSGSPMEALDAGSYPARLVQLVLLGLQPQRAFQGADKPPAEMMYLGYELSHEFMKDDDGNDQLDKPRWAGEDMAFYNLEADLAKSTKRYHAIDPQGSAGGDWLSLVGSPCQVTLSKEPRKGHDGQFVNYVSYVSGAANMPGYEQPELVNPPRVFDLEEPDMEVYAKLPKWLREKIATNLNFKGSALETALGGSGKTEAKASPPVTGSASTPPTPPAPPSDEASS